MVSIPVHSWYGGMVFARCDNVGFNFFLGVRPNEVTNEISEDFNHWACVSKGGVVQGGCAINRILQ